MDCRHDRWGSHLRRRNTHSDAGHNTRSNAGDNTYSFNGGGDSDGDYELDAG